MIREHHQHTIDKLVEHFSKDPRYPALIIGGSVAKGTARDDSDVDVLLVTTSEEHTRCKEQGEHSFIMQGDICDYPGGYIDGKYIDERFIIDCADHGSEPSRWAFTGAFVAYSHIPGLDDVVKRIPVYQDHEQRQKIESFYSQVWVIPWFIGEGEQKNNPYLVHKYAADMVLFSGRLILAHNRLLFPCHKWLMKQVERAQNKPVHFEELAMRLLERPSKALADEIHTCLFEHYGDHGMSWDQAITRFVQDIEWNWRDGRPPLQDC